jgi:membrane-associated phospholipid phosphatase
VSDATASPMPALRRTRRQRRPTGAPPPLPGQPGLTTMAGLALAAIVVSAAFLVSELTPWLRAVDQASTWLLRQLAAVRTPWLTGPAGWISTTGSTWHPVIGLAVVLLVIVFRRWRHLLVLNFCVFFVEIVSGSISDALSRPRPYGVRIIGRWNGYSAPSPAVMTATFLLMAGVYCLVVPGRPRSVAKAVAAAVVALFCLSRLYLAVDHPDDVLFGAVLGLAIPVAAFRFFTPDEVFPVVYRRGRTAHVDVTGRRGTAIRQAVHHQLGLTVLDITPVGLESSAGSTPLRLTVQGDPDESLFGKLYTRGHVRADRWYKLWRTILYGALEDEHPFHSVRQLAQYEDYVLRLLRDAGVAAPRRTGSWRSRRNASICSSPSSSPGPSRPSPPPGGWRARPSCARS